MPVASLRPLRARCFAQQKVLQNETAFAARERCTTDPASYPLVDGLRPGFAADYVIKRLAIRAREKAERRRPAASHGSPPNAQFLDYRQRTLKDTVPANVI